MKPFLAFDIETYASWAALPPRVQTYLEGRDRARGIQSGGARSWSQRASLLPGPAQVIAIGLWGDPGGGRALSLVPDLALSEEQREGGLRCFREEGLLLEAFWEEVRLAQEEGARLVSFNGRAFDGPILALRSALLGVRPSLDLGVEALHCDLEEVLSFRGARRSHFSLDYWCAIFGVPSPKEGLKGAEVSVAFEGGEYESIARYGQRDAEATGLLYAKLAPTLLGDPAAGMGSQPSPS